MKSIRTSIRRRWPLTVAALALGAAALLALHGRAAPVPRRLPYQGVLTDAAGVPISGTRDLVLRLYPDATASTPLCSETESATPISNGLFRVVLGDGGCTLDPDWFTSSTAVHLELVVDGDVLSPRVPLFPVPAAFQAQHAEFAPGVTPIGGIVAWAKNLPGVPATLADGWTECNGQTLDDPASPLHGRALPNLNAANRFLRGSSASGAVGGEERHTLTIAEMPAHSHSVQTCTMSTGTAFFARSGNSGGCGTLSTQSAGSGTSHENRPPYYDVVWIIRVR